MSVSNPVGMVTSFDYYDTGDDVSSIVYGKVKSESKPDGTHVEYTYTTWGDSQSVTLYDLQMDPVVYVTNDYTYFTNGVGWEPNTITSRIFSADDTVLSGKVTTFTREEGDTTNAYDDVYLLTSIKEWYGTGSEEYAERCWTHTTNYLVAAEKVRTASGESGLRLVWTNYYDATGLLTQRVDVLTNKVAFVYDDRNLMTNTLRTVTFGGSQTNLSTSYSYDDLNRLTDLVYPDGVGESWTHVSWGLNVQTHTDRSGNVTTNSYDENKRLTTMTVTSTNETQLSYSQLQRDNMGTVTNVVDAMGSDSLRLYDLAGRLTNRTDKLGRETIYEYNYPSGQLCRVIYPNGSKVESTYCDAGRVTNVIHYSTTSSSEVLSSVVFERDALGRPIAITDALGNVTSNKYDIIGRLVQRWYPDGSYQKWEFDRVGNLIKVIGPLTSTDPTDMAAATVSNSYDIADRLVSTTDPEGHVTTIAYDDVYTDKPRTISNDNGSNIWVSAYDVETGWLLTNTTHGVELTFGYDDLGNQTKTVYPDGSWVERLYDGSWLSNTTSRTGNQTTFTRDAPGRVVTVTDALSNSTHYGYDAVGNLTNLVDAMTNETTYVYDDMNRATNIVLADSRAITNTFDLMRRLVSKAGAGSVPVSHTYDLLGRVTSLIDGEGNQTGFAYDSMGRRTKKTYADGTFYSYAYDGRGRLSSRTDAIGRTTAYGYNNVGQLTNVNYATDTDVEATYDNLGRLSNRTDDAGQWSWTYWGDSSRVLTESSPSGETVTYTYDADTFYLASVGLNALNTTAYNWYQGRLTNVSSRAGDFGYAYKADSEFLETTTYPNGVLSATRSYDAANRLISIVNKKSGVTVSSFTYQLDATGRRTKRAHADGSYINYTYDLYDQLTGAEWVTNTGYKASDLAYNFSYEYDEAGNRLREDRAQLDLDGTFNSVNQLVHSLYTGNLDVYGTVAGTNEPYTVKVNGAEAETYQTTNFLGSARLHQGSNTISIVAYDNGGKQTEELRTVYAAQTNPQEFRYDLNGNLTYDSFRNYTWTEENRLAVVDATSAVPDEKRRKCEFTYDGSGRRFRKVVSVWTNGAWSVSSTNTFVYAGWNLIAEISDEASGTTTNHYIWGLDVSQSLSGAGGIGGVLAQITATSTNLYLCDVNGNVVALADANGSLTAQYEYGPFGRLTYAAGTYAYENPFRFSTKYADDETGLLYYGYRYYSPNTGRWISRDPIGERGGLNLYGFVGNGPVEYVDALGLEAYVKVEKNFDVTIEIPVEWDSSVTDKEQKRISDNIHNMWSTGKFGGNAKYGRLEVNVSVVKAGKHNLRNKVRVRRGCGRAVAADRNGVTFYETDGPYEHAHEAGHLMGQGHWYVDIQGHEDMDESIMAYHSEIPNEELRPLSDDIELIVSDAGIHKPGASGIVGRRTSR